MKPLKEVFEPRQTTLWIETQNTIAFLRPVPDILIWTPCPTACLAESLRLRQVRFTAAERLFGALLFAQIKSKGHARAAAFFKQRGSDQHGHAAASFPQLLLLEGLQAPAHLELWYPVPFVAVKPFRRGYLRPAPAARHEILPRLSRRAQH